MDSKRLEALKNRKSANAGLADDAALEEEERYFDILEKKDEMEDKMLNTKEIDVKAVTCSICSYTAFRKSDLCVEKGHQVKVVTAKKRFFECTKCKNRIVALDKYPKRSCDKCGESGWSRTGMIRERKGPLFESEKLLIRGIEQNFVGANVGSNQLNLNSM